MIHFSKVYTENYTQIHTHIGKNLNTTTHTHTHARARMPFQKKHVYVYDPIIMCVFYAHVLSVKRMYHLEFRIDIFILYNV